MCYECYEECGTPTIVNEKTIAAAELIAKVYEFSGVGGNAHIVVDDWNLEDERIIWCLENMTADTQHKDEEQQIAALNAERECLETLLLLDMDERVSALALHEGFLSWY